MEFFKSKYFEDIFEYGLKLAKERKKNEANEYFKAYIQYIYDENTRDEVPTIKDAENRAKGNFGYYAGYYGDDIRKKIYKYYEAAHPIFGNRYNISSEEAFNIGYALGKNKK